MRNDINSKTHYAFGLFLLFGLFGSMFGQIQSNVYYRGDLNSWGSTAMSWRDLGTDSWMTSIQSSSDNGTSQFKFDNETSWVGNDWSRGDVISIGSLTQWYNPNGGNGIFSATNGKYYTFVIKDVADDTNSEGYIFEFDGAPVSISHFDETGSGGDNTPFDFEDSDSLHFKIDCGTTQPPADQKFYIRYYFDSDNEDGYTSFGAANIVGTANTGFTGSNYYAFITVSKPGNASTVTSYSMTTESSFSLNNSNIDLTTVYFDNNSGANYTKTINGGSLSIVNPIDLPSGFHISSIYPNPFNPETTIQYRLEVASDITIEVFDISGQLVETLINGFSMPGEHQIIWKPKDISSGIYMVQMTLGSQRFKKQITYLK
ncbi:MAG: T9SS type A sorting domain-containing protein [Candidatus Marinimicrobia bacterium]|nr:T9SS type A sorting domain-containing protein [Candidatus Neomarinimicrobiota bacterium]